MSNNQWNNGQADGQWQPQPNQDWNQGAQPQTSATDWAAAQEQPAEWNQAAQPQGGAQDWNPAASQPDWNAQQQAGAQDWNQQQPAPEWGQQPAQEWNQQSAQDWSAPQPQGSADWNAQQAQGWNQQPGAFQGAPGFGNQPAPGQQWQGARPNTGNGGLAKVFDFSFKKFALPEAGGVIFTIAAVCFGIWWIFDLVQALSVGFTTAGITLQVIIGGLARMVLGLLLTRVLIEGASAAVKLANKADADEDPATRA